MMSISPIRRSIAVAAALSMLLHQGCSLFAPSTQSLSVAATEPEAELFVDWAPVGRGAATVRVRRDETHAIMARVGKRAGTMSIGTTVSTTGILDIIGGALFLIPLIGLAAPGFYKLERDSVTVYVPPE